MNRDKSIKVINIIFTIIFCILLIIPVSKIDMSVRSSKENRYLSKFPSKISLDIVWGKEFNNWISDRFNMRGQLLKLNTLYSCVPNIYYCINKKIVIDKRNNVVFNNGILKKDNYPFITIYDFKTIEGIKYFNDWCKQRNIKLYILLAPPREDFIKYNVPAKFNRHIIDKTGMIIKNVKTVSDTKIIYPYNEMMDMNNETPVYFKTDHHWTQTGAYVGYVELIKAIQKDFPDVKIADRSKFNIVSNKNVRSVFNSRYNSGSLIRNSYLPDFYVKQLLDTDYLYYEPKESLKVFTYEKVSTAYDKSDMTYDAIFKNDNIGASDRKVMLIGNSFLGNLLIFLPYSFKRLFSLADNNRSLKFDTYAPIIETYKPDIIIINLHTVQLSLFQNLNKFK